MGLEPINLSENLGYSALKNRVRELARRINLLTQMEAKLVSADSPAKFDYSDEAIKLDLPATTNLLERLVAIENVIDSGGACAIALEEAEEKIIELEVEVAEQAETIVLLEEQIVLLEEEISELNPDPGTINGPFEYFRDDSGAGFGSATITMTSPAGTSFSYSVALNPGSSSIQVTFWVSGFWGNYSTITASQLGGISGNPGTLTVRMRVGYFSGITLKGLEYYDVIWGYDGS